MLKNRNGLELGSDYLQYLPGFYRDDEFMERFLLIFESIMKPLENMVGGMDVYFDPRLAPETLLPWLAFWVGLSLEPDWPIDRRRELVKSAFWLYRWQGTKRGLAEYLRIYTGSRPDIIEYIPGMVLEGDTKLGNNTRLGSSGTGHHFTVSLELESGSKISEDTIRAIIEAQKPAHTAYSLELGWSGQNQPEKKEA